MHIFRPRYQVDEKGEKKEVIKYEGGSTNSILQNFVESLYVELFSKL